MRGASLSIHEGERICLIGRNGAGKSTLFRIITGEIQPDCGDVRMSGRLRISQLPQTLPRVMDQSVAEYVATGLSGLQNLIRQYRLLASQAQAGNQLAQMEALQHEIELQGGWNIQNLVQTVLTEMELPAGKPLTALSGGWLRRTALARALVSHPDLLLLDEPTNHLDLDTIRWLEDRIHGFSGSVLFVTHDRAFLNRLATRIVELDRPSLTSWPGNYRKYLQLKELAMAEEARDNALFDKRLAQEEAWIRQGVKARRTRNEGRVRALQAMREAYLNRDKPQDQVRIQVGEAGLSGRKVIDAYRISYGYGDTSLIRDFSIKIRRGDRIGLIGNNGIGKTTLLKLLLGELQPLQGTVKEGTNLEKGYFDQHRGRLDDTKTVAGFIGDGADYIRINGRERHVIGYLKGFLFSPRRSMTPIRLLSGGERNRLILAKLLMRPTNLLVLDEPTNDLDVETLEVLEARLCEYQGTLIIVSHDREFLDNVVTSTLVFESDGVIRRYAGGYSDWLRQGRNLAENESPERRAGATATDSHSGPGRERRPAKLSYKLKLELEQLPGRIEALECQLKSLHAQTQQPDFYRQPYSRVEPVLDELKSIENELERAMLRWEELESMHSATG